MSSDEEAHDPRRHLLKFYFHGLDDALIWETRRDEMTRLRDPLETGEPLDGFRFETVDGKEVFVNLGYVQAVHFLWEPSPSPVDPTRYEGPIQMALAGRHEPLEMHTEHHDQLYDFFTELEHGPEVVEYPGFDDEDGERLVVNANEVVYAVAPIHLLDEGRRQVYEEDGIR